MRTVSLYSLFSYFLFFFHILWWAQEAIHIKLLISSTVGSQRGWCKDEKSKRIAPVHSENIVHLLFSFSPGVGLEKCTSGQVLVWPIYVPIF